MKRAQNASNCKKRIYYFNWLLNKTKNILLFLCNFYIIKKYIMKSFIKKIYSLFDLFVFV